MSLQPSDYPASYNENKVSNHIVQFYETDPFLIEKVADFLSSGISRGEAGLLILTQSHQKSLEVRLVEMGLDVNRLKDKGQLVHLDAQILLNKILLDDKPDSCLLAIHVETVIQKILSNYSKLSAIGEMVGILWAENRIEAAIQLEVMWNKSISNRPISLLCVYPVINSIGNPEANFEAQICGQHTNTFSQEIHPTIGFTSDEKLRSLALLREKTILLEREVQARKQSEAALRHVQEDLEQQVGDLHNLHDLSSRLLLAVDLEFVLNEVLRATMDVYRTDMAALYLSTPEEDGLRLAVRIGFTPDVANLYNFIRPGEAMTGTCFSEKKSVLVSDLETDLKFKDYRSNANLAGFRSIHCTPLFNRSGKIIGVLSAYFKEPHLPVTREIRMVDLLIRIAADAIEMAQMREKVREDELVKKKLEISRQRLASIVEYANIGIISKDTKGIIKTWNSGAEKIFGYSAQEIIGRPGLELIPKEKWSEEPMILERLLNGELLEELDTIRLHKNGTHIPVSLTFSPIYSDSGIFEGFSKIVHDLTERRQFEIELKKSEMQFREMADAAPVFVWTTDAHGSMTYFNKTWLDFRGSPLEKELGQGWMQALHPEDLAKFTKDFTLSMPDQSTFRLEVRIQRADKAFRWILNTVTPQFSQSQGLVGFIGSGLDITDIRDAENKIHQAQKLEAVGRLAGGIAHDFNNLLTVINGYSALALGKINGMAPLHEYLTEVINSGERAASLTQQLLAYGRKQILTPSIFSLNEVLTKMKKVIVPLVGEEVQLNVQLQPDLGFVKADLGQVQQIILNLVLNARDAMPDGGTLTIITQNEMLGETRNPQAVESLRGHFVKLSVQDTGFGMDQETKARVFEPFFTTKAIGQGTGLGLSSVYGILKQSQGGIQFESEIGIGTTFHIFLPIEGEKKSEAIPIQEFNSQTLDPIQATILLIEDEETVRKFIEHTLSSMGYQILVAKDGFEALEIVMKNSAIDILLTDVVLPKMNGGKTAEKIKEIIPEIRILFMSGYAANVFLAKGIMKNDTWFLQKPFTQEQLATMIKDILSVSNFQVT